MKGVKNTSPEVQSCWESGLTCKGADQGLSICFNPDTAWWLSYPNSALLHTYSKQLWGLPGHQTVPAFGSVAIAVAGLGLAARGL